MSVYNLIENIKNPYIRRSSTVFLTVFLFFWYSIILTLYALIEASKVLISEWETKYKNEYENYAEWVKNTWVKNNE